MVCFKIVNLLLEQQCPHFLAHVLYNVERVDELRVVPCCTVGSYMIDIRVDKSCIEISRSEREYRSMIFTPTVYPIDSYFEYEAS